MSSDEEYEYCSESEDDMVPAAGAGGAPAPLPLRRAPSYEVISVDELHRRQQHMLGEVCDTLGVPTTVGGVLLRHFHWNKTKALDQWWSAQDSLRSLLGLPDDALDVVAPVSTSSELFDCPSCFDEVPMSKTTALNCGHRLCNDCWRGDIKTAILGGPDCLYRLCPGGRPKCPIVIPETLFKDFAPPPLFARYHKFAVQSFVQDNPYMKPCPAPGCDNVVSYNGSGSRAVKCSCGHEFCWKCQEPAHIPASCEFMRQWEEKKVEMSITNADLWSAEFVKHCPKCRRRIWRDGGCNHMTCRRNDGGCGHEFCWMCFADWSTHGSATGGYYQCNIFEEANKTGKAEGAVKEAYSAAQKRAKLKAETDRYEFYVGRFRGAMQAAEFAYGTSREKMMVTSYRIAELIKGVEAASHVQVLEEAMRDVAECRKVTAYMYVVAYLLEKGSPEEDLFVFLQRDLESYTDRLQELLEQQLEKVKAELEAGGDAITMVDFLREVRHFHECVQKFREQVVSGMQEGLTET